MTFASVLFIDLRIKPQADTATQQPVARIRQDLPQTIPYWTCD